MRDPIIERLRARIAAADCAILESVNARLELVAELKRHKEAHEIEFVDPQQEERLLEGLEEANTGPLSRNGLRQLWKEILALTKREV